MSYLDEMFGLDGKTAVVSGGAGVIGTVMSEALLRAGARVMIWSRSQESVDSALEKLQEISGSETRVAGMRVDAGKEDEVEQALWTLMTVWATRPASRPWTGPVNWPGNQASPWSVSITAAIAAPSPTSSCTP